MIKNVEQDSCGISRYEAPRSMEGGLSRASVCVTTSSKRSICAAAESRPARMVYRMNMYVQREATQGLAIKSRHHGYVAHREGHLRLVLYIHSLLHGSCSQPDFDLFTSSCDREGLYIHIYAAGAQGMRQEHQGLEGGCVGGHAAPEGDVAQSGQPGNAQEGALGGQVGDVRQRQGLQRSHAFPAIAVWNLQHGSSSSIKGLVSCHSPVTIYAAFALPA